MWKRGRARGEEERIGGQWREGGRVIRGGGEQRERGQGFYDVWEGEVTFPLTFILAFFSSSCIAPSHTKTHKHTYSFSHTLLYAGSHAPAHLQQCLQSALEQAHTLTPLYLFFNHSLFCFLPCAGPLATWPVFQVHSPGNSGPNQGGIPIPPGSVSQVPKTHNTNPFVHACRYTNLFKNVNIVGKRNELPEEA